MTASVREPSAAHSGIPSAALIRRIRRRLLAWYDEHRRDLPWRRREGDAYAQWVAEVMLQQTRVETVIPYYERFLKRLPDAASLSRARHETVLKLWEGLGYYRRIVHLHEAARMLQQQGRAIPSSAAELRALPGIGEYIAAAISSIAFGRREAAVDGNVARVISRLFALADAPRTPAGRGAVRDIASALVSPRRPGDFNQAWMDLGSAVCTPGTPDCPRCPLRGDCRTASPGESDRRPHRTAPRREVPRVSIAVALIRHRDRWLVRRRPRGGLWSGLWEFPSIEMGRDDVAAVGIAGPAGSPRGASPHRSMQDSAQVLREFAESLGAVPVLAEPVARLSHQLTHRALDFEVSLCQADAGKGDAHLYPRSPWRWVTEAEFNRLPVSTAHRRIFAATVGCASLDRVCESRSRKVRRSPSQAGSKRSPVAAGASISRGV